MTAKDKGETGKTPGIRELNPDEIDSVSGGVGTAPKSPGWIEPDPEPWIEPDTQPKAPR